MTNFLSNNQKDLEKSLNDQKQKIEEAQAQQLAVTMQMPYINLRTFPVDLQSLSLMSREESLQSESAPIYKDHKDLKIATVNPSNPFLHVLKEKLSKEYKINIYFCSRGGLMSLQKFYDKVLRPSSPTNEQIVLDQTSQKKIADVLPSTPVTEVLQILFSGAVSLGASDIHLEPEEKSLKIRYRIDGVLQDAASMDAGMHKQLISRIKLLAKLKLNISNEAQDGRFTVMNNEKELDVRVSVLPSSFGEAVVLRLLGVGVLSPDIDNLGLSGKAYKQVMEALQKTTGMIIATGPTGSGKTTTLYSCLKFLNKPGIKIITLEDPVEYKLSGIQQTPIDHRVDFSFDKALRSVLRQDPDVVMVGEIRDPETGDTALQAALTGHVVLTTLHTNDAAGAIPRLLTMGIKPFVISPAVNVIIAQRLVRRLCEFCMVQATLDQVLLEKVKHELYNIHASAEVVVPKEFIFYSSPGCDKCDGLGYKGRIGIYEVVTITDEMRELILTEPSGLSIKKIALENGSLTMLQDGLLKALNKLTDVTEVIRVVG